MAEKEKSIAELIAEALAAKQGDNFEKNQNKDSDVVPASSELKQMFEKHEKQVEDAHRALFESGKLTDAQLAEVKERALSDFTKSSKRIDEVVQELRAKDQRIDELKEEFLKSRTGMDLQRTENDNRRNSFVKFLKTGLNSLTETEQKSFGARGFKKAADGTITTDDNFGGGFAIRMPQLLTMVEEKPDISALETYCRREEIASLSALVPMRKSMERERSHWAKENTDATEKSVVAFESIPVQLNDLYCNFQVTRQYLQDTLNPENWIVNQARLNDRRAINEDMLYGDGNSKLRGIFESIKTKTKDGFSVVKTSEKGIIKLSDLKNVWSGRLVAPYRSESKWYMSTNALANLRFEEGTNGQFKWSTDIREGIPLQLNGQPVIEVYELPDVETGNFCLMYGDLRSAYVIAENPNSYFVRDEVSLAMKRVVLFYFFRFIDGKPENVKALNLLQVA